MSRSLSQRQLFERGRGLANGCSPTVIFASSGTNGRIQEELTRGRGAAAGALPEPACRSLRELACSTSRRGGCRGLPPSPSVAGGFRPLLRVWVEAFARNRGKLFQRRLCDALCRLTIVDPFQPACCLSPGSFLQKSSTSSACTCTLQEISRPCPSASDRRSADGGPLHLALHPASS